ncbi:MAG TPA: hypothetical protein VFZ53_26250, partial [Polyangiaceae bacterium]
AFEANAQAAWCAQLQRWRDDAEAICERQALLERQESAHCARAEAELSDSPELLDREITRLSAELAERDLALGIVAESARKAQVWHRLGFSSEAQYVRERVGVSLSSLKAKRILAARAARVPEVAAALSSGRIGYEAAYLLSRVATAKTAQEWIARAERRTVKHLREEVEAAELLIRVGQPRDQLPLDEQSLDALFELERFVVSGEAFQANAHSQTSGPVARETHVSSSRRARGSGRVTLRFRVKATTARYFRALERGFERVRSRVCRAPVSFLRFLCENFCRIWLSALRQGCLTVSGALPEYFHIYRRDAFRCTSPVCSRRDVTPHHLVFRSCGGSDEDDNVASLCTWCHLHGVHEGRIVAEPPASGIRWRIGRTGTVRVSGRTKIRDFSRGSFEEQTA